MTKETQIDSLSPEQAKVCLQFLQRTQMQGAEMPAYVSLFNSLTAIAGTEDDKDGKEA